MKIKIKLKIKIAIWQHATKYLGNMLWEQYYKKKEVA